MTSGVLFGLKHRTCPESFAFTRNNPRTANPAVEKPEIHINLPAGSYNIRWYNPRRGTWEQDTRITTTDRPHHLDAPNIGRITYEDWVVLISALPQ